MCDEIDLETSVASPEDTDRASPTRVSGNCYYYNLSTIGKPILPCWNSKNTLSYKLIDHIRDIVTKLPVFIVRGRHKEFAAISISLFRITYEATNSTHLGIVAIYM